MKPSTVQREARRVIAEARAVVDERGDGLSVKAQSAMFSAIIEARRPGGVSGPRWRQAVLNEQLAGY